MVSEEGKPKKMSLEIGTVCFPKACSRSQYRRGKPEFCGFAELRRQRSEFEESKWLEYVGRILARNELQRQRPLEFCRREPFEFLVKHSTAQVLGQSSQG